MTTEQKPTGANVPDIKIEAKADSKDLADVTNRFLDRLSGAVGKLYEPIHVVRMAKAESKALTINAETEATLPAIKQRALDRLIQQETRKQENLEHTIEQAKGLLNENAKPEQLDEDWLNEWSERAARVSDKELQSLWARIMAGETNSPKSFRKSVLHTVSMLEKSDAEIFSKLCKFVVHVGGPEPLIFETDNDIYNDHGIDFGTMGDLEALGLIFFSPISGFAKLGYPKQFMIAYGNIPLSITLPDGVDRLGIGKVRFTEVGRQLFPLSGAQLVPNFPQYIADKYAKENVNVAGPSIKAPGNDE